MSAISIGEARKAFFIVQNRISERLNDKIRPPGASRIPLAIVPDANGRMSDWLVILYDFFAEVRRGTAENWPMFCLGEVYERAESCEGMLEGLVSRYAESGPLSRGKWSQISRAIENHLAVVNEWFAALDKPTPPDNLTGAQLDIWNVVVEEGKRLNRKEIEARLNFKGVGQGESILKANLATLSQRLRILPCRTGRGYGLPNWD